MSIITTGGPLVLMGISAEESVGSSPASPFFPRPSAYVSIINNILNKVQNGESNILVIGGGKSETDDVTRFWKMIDNLIADHNVEFINGPDNIRNMTLEFLQSFAMIAVVSALAGPPTSGLITTAELAALNTKQSDIATFLSTGGGHLGFLQGGAENGSYQYLDALGDISIARLRDDKINITQAGLDFGFTNQLNSCCWVDLFVDFPDFLDVLASSPVEPTAPRAIGGIVEGNCSESNINRIQNALTTIGTEIDAANGIVCGLSGLEGLSRRLNNIINDVNPVIFRCGDENNCVGLDAFTNRKGGNIITLCNFNLNSNRFNAVVFHELIHAAGGTELDAEAFENHCFRGRGATPPTRGDLPNILKIVFKIFREDRDTVLIGDSFFLQGEFVLLKVFGDDRGEVFVKRIVNGEIRLGDKLNVNFPV